MSLISTVAPLLVIAAVLIGVIALVTKWQWVLLDAAREQGLTEAYKHKSQEEFDAKFYEDVKLFRECAEKAGCDMAAFDMRVAVRKGYIDEFLANARHFYRQHPCTPSDS